MKKVTIIWLWYVWYPLACAIHQTKKYEVYGYDIDPEKIKAIQAWKSPMEDEEINNLFWNPDFSVSNDSSLIEWSDYIIIAVPTPIKKDKEPDLWPISKSIQTITPYIKKWVNIIIESTINPWVCDEVIIPLIQEKTNMKAWKDFHLAHCPERINPWDKKWNVLNITRNIGATTKEACHQIAKFYRSFIDAPVIEMSDIRHTEATKIVENTFRDINIAYVNELAKSFDILWLDIKEVINWAANKPFGFMAHYPWCWVWWHCIPVDPYYLIRRAKLSWFDHDFLLKAREINNSMPQYIIEKTILLLNKNHLCVAWSQIVLMWMSYKKDVADLRESPSIIIAKKLEALWADLTLYDPYIKEYNNWKFEDHISNNQIVIFATDHSIFKKIENNITKLKNKIIIDGRNFLNKELLIQEWIQYTWIGR